MSSFSSANSANCTPQLSEGSHDVEGASQSPRTRPIHGEIIRQTYDTASLYQEQAVTDPTPPQDTSHLAKLSDQARISIVKEWQKKMAPDQFLRRPCAACSALKYHRELTKKPASRYDLTLLRNDEIPRHLRPATYNFEAYDRAILDPDGLEDKSRKGWMWLCPTCLRDLAKGSMPKLALSNWLYFAREHLPDPVRRALKEMSIFEKALICRVRTNSLLCRFTGIDDDLYEESFAKGARHIKGNIMSTPLDAMRVNHLLPPSPEQIADTMCALVMSAKPPTERTIKKLTPIMVRKSRVKLLIQFLIENNPHYSTSQEFGGFSSEHLDALFTGEADQGVPSAVDIGHLPLNPAIESLTEDHIGRLDSVDGLFIENVAYTMGDHSAQSYDEMTFQALNRCTEGNPFVYSRSGSHPVPDINNPNWLSWAHPNADPFGLAGFHEPRRKKPIGMEQQLRHLLSTSDPYIENDPEIAFDVYNIIRKAAVNTSMIFSVPYPVYSRLVDQIASLDQQQVMALRERYKCNPNYSPTEPAELNIVRIMTSISPITRRIPGSVSQKLKMRNEIRAMISQRGSPTLFVTLNPSDYYHPIVSVLATRGREAQHLRALDTLTSGDRSKLAVKHPVACAVFFDSMITAFINIILRHGKKGPGIFGQCNAYYGTVETQGRGTLHCHLLIWLEGHLPAEVLADTLINSKAYGDELVGWIDSVTDSGFIGSRSYLNSLPDGGEDEVQRKGEPHPASIPEPKASAFGPRAFKEEMNEYVDDLLTRYNWHVHTGSCWKYLGPKEERTEENCRFGMDGSTSTTSEIDREEGSLKMRRKHPKMTHFNPTTTFLMKCNTDVKFIGSGLDAKAFMYYVTDYITKAPLTMHAGLTALSYAIRQGENRGVLRTEGRDEGTSRRAMTIAINSMLGHQEISHPQVMSYILGGGENYTSESFQSFNWGEAVRYVTKTISTVLSPIVYSEEKDEMESVNISLTSDRGKLQPTSQLLDYIFRPEDEQYSTMSLYTHIASTRKVSSAHTTDQQPHTNSRTQSRPFSSPAHPQFTTHHLGKRLNRVVPVLLGPRIPRKDGNEAEKEEWAKYVCILFKPWRVPLELNMTGGSWWPAATQLVANLNRRDSEIVVNMSLVSEAKQARDARPRHSKKGGRMNMEDMEDVMETNSELANNSSNAYANAITLSEAAMDPFAHNNMSAPSNLETLLGPSYIPFRTCHPISKRQSTDTTDDNFQVEDKDQAIISQQRSFMVASKRNVAKPKKSRKSKEKGRNDQVFEPTAEVTALAPSVSAKQWEKTETSRYEAEMLAASKGIKDNPEQLRAYSLVARHMIEGGAQLMLYVGGKGGTGKSYLIETLVELFEQMGRRHELRLGAFTGIAATLIGGNTLHSLLSIGPHYKKSSEAGKTLSQEWRRVKYLIIDEVSMISAQFMATISSRMKVAKCESPSDSAKPFGNVNMIFLGDFLQLPPPTQLSVYSWKLVRAPTFMQARNNDGLDAISGAYLWRLVSQVVTLKLAKRHEGDPTLTDILDRIRNNSCLENDGRPVVINGTSLVEHLRQRDMAYVFAHSPGELALFQDAPVVVGTKKVRDEVNALMLVSHARRLDQVPHMYHAADTIAGKRVTTPAAGALWNLSSTITKDSFGILPMFIGMRVMVTENVSLRYRVVNGAEGVVTGFRYSEDNHRRYLEVVYVRIESKGGKISVPGLESGVAAIFPSSSSVIHTIRHNGTVSKSFRRNQVPLIPAYSYTHYKSQGRTLTHAIVDLVSARGQGIYVMLSRVTTLKGLLILRWFPQSKILEKHSGELRDELQRLGHMNTTTIEDEPYLYPEMETEGMDIDEAEEDVPQVPPRIARQRLSQSADALLRNQSEVESSMEMDVSY
ncbi:hypothetical protein D9611_000598 [Ephemerocybe angulata]|uniref:ATP-dependent DNA helicase n=1 Tax=Ephemerocybe angulata TaxID=980116 RepID=A0A8H5F6H2_9AGAR|nr:hypothetical protein D9611_000598 [Tulosesus angulatus]